MKYVLVIDVPEPVESKDVKIDYLCYYHCGNIIKHEIDAFLKPLPQKKVGDDLYERYGSWTPSDEREVSYRIGFNDCLDEIIGETE